MRQVPGTGVLHVKRNNSIDARKRPGVVTGTDGGDRPSHVTIPAVRTTQYVLPGAELSLKSVTATSICPANDSTHCYCYCHSCGILSTSDYLIPTGH
ncbi:hypothetical protein CLIM01_02307 [Colletotrichum limetticola]|uniref:Uncharacterized protein n=1 Tax=Colletotrichum limetticola TaxID=1209924 RepID=A0ABQ9Q917_9PEZI|nr:hypothetical protein CLIM01_02307 [Colletotrichum limetticola]